jgi:SAM-dependent methyltransferase
MKFNMNPKQYLEIIAHLETCLDQFGDTPQGVDWPKAEDVDTRHRVMLGVVQPGLQARTSILDFGCGLSHFYDFLQRNKIDWVDYTGLDISEKYIARSREKYPHNPYYCVDILEDAGKLPQFDYVVMNGVFTEKVTLSHEAMFDYFQRLVKRVFELARLGIAFNVMSKQVDWEREDLFHLPLDDLAWFLKRELTRYFVIRSDYGLYEYTVYVYRQPSMMP